MAYCAGWNPLCDALLVGQVLVQLQNGDAQAAEEAGAAQALRTENEALQARLTQVMRG